MTCATASLISYLSISYLLTKLSEHRFCSPKCVVAEISVYSDISFPLKELSNEK